MFKKHCKSTAFSIDTQSLKIGKLASGFGHIVFFL